MSRPAAEAGRVVPLGPRIQKGLLSTTNVAGANRALVLQALADHGAVSRADLARLSGVTRASIGGVVAGLLDEGILQELPVNVGARRVGKPSRPLWFGELGRFGAVVVRPRLVDVAIVDSHGGISAQMRAELPATERVEEFDAAALASIRTMFADWAGSLVAVGLAIPGFFDADGKILASTTIRALIGSHLPELLAQATDSAVVLEDDARALALGQRWFGQARGVRDFVAIELGEGIGAGIMLDGHLHRGPLMASEVGHITVDIRGDRCHCGLIGCWETIASLQWLRNRAERIGVEHGASVTPRRLAELAENGDTAAHGVLDEYADHVAVGIVNLFHILSVPLFILHGEVVDAGERFLGQLRERVAARTMNALMTGPTITVDENTAQSGILGAAAAAITYSLGVTL